MSIKKKDAEAFIEIIQSRPRELVENEFYIYDQKSGMKWWTGNGGWSFEVYNFSLVPKLNSLGMKDFLFWRLMQKGKCWRALKKWREENPDLCKL